MYIDFKQIDSGEEFELLCEDLLRKMGYKIEEKVGRGPDLGKDLIVSYSSADPAGFKESHRYLVECKHFAKSGESVKEEHIGNVAARMATHRCDRYLLITSTVPAEKTRVQLAAMPQLNSSFKAETWSKGELRRLLLQHPDVRDLHIPLAENIHTAKLIRDAISATRPLEVIKKLIAMNPHVLPIERYVRKQYEFKSAVNVPLHGIVDFVAARADTQGMVLYLYYLGSPYESSFRGKKPKPELNSMLKRSCDLIFDISLPLTVEHSLHHETITGFESGGMKSSWIELRRKSGLGPYTRVNVFIVVGQRSNHGTNHDAYIRREQRNWLERYNDFPHGAKINCDVPAIQIMSYDRLLSDGSLE